jgi:diphthamide synthase (EF-2-diphthine--ammonia ligase)
MALASVRRDETIDVVGLLVTMNELADRVAMHAVRRSLVEAQADRLDLPLTFVEIPEHCTNAVYEERMTRAIDTALRDDIEHFVFGDLFLEDVRHYREQQLDGTGISPRFPLWGVPTDELAHSVIEWGVRAVITCVDPKQIPPAFIGRTFDAALLEELPVGVDPCGERGEFHTFAFDGPGFSSPIKIEVGEVVERDGFVFCDVLPS